jgi:hypothetical protein
MLLCEWIACSPSGLPSPTPAHVVSDVRNYLPLKSGKYWEYQVDSTFYDIGPAGQFSYQTTSYLRYEVKDTLLNTLSDSSRLIFRYYRSSDTSQWAPHGTILLTSTANRLEWQEGNLRFVKLIAPLEIGENWNGNRYLPDDLTLLVQGEPLEIFKNWLPYRLESFLQEDRLGAVNQNGKVVIPIEYEKIEIEKGRTKLYQSGKLDVVYLDEPG